ncbi:MAG: indolepyruvate oxidoreductase [Bdellovibrionales bacterium GWB1_52_6]|nr:MAG: indolepyruvate oxidoreductase [Bdellovibrionales bacterium GWB1_52_6]OFZ02876.1 MAG: indolepyruvate oxidoreductase [Bdellovibrionales bacterium GWA1_52_35]HCM38459.1 indolepyruvate oxidoreductase subunit beta [Bdellovibrionales bacterium]
MKCDLIFAGVGGQGVLSVSAAIGTAALSEGLHMKQSEVHGMSQRGGAVTAALRISDVPVHSPLVSSGSAQLLLSMEPLEALRYLPMLSKDATVISAMAPVKNIGNYPDLQEIYAQIRSLPKAFLIDAEQLAREAGSVRTSNIVLVGAASKFLPVQADSLVQAIRSLFERKGEKIVEMNLKAFQLGRAAAH